MGEADWKQNRRMEANRRTRQVNTQQRWFVGVTTSRCAYQTESAWVVRSLQKYSKGDAPLRRDQRADFMALAVDCLNEGESLVPVVRDCRQHIRLVSSQLHPIRSIRTMLVGRMTGNGRNLFRFQMQQSACLSINEFKMKRKERAWNKWRTQTTSFDGWPCSAFPLNPHFYNTHTLCFFVVTTGLLFFAFHFACAR